jgi:superfamily II DNA or RNA helicase/HKD family nuclease
MVKYNISYKDNRNNPNCITGDKDHLYDKLKESIEKAKKIDIIVAFLMESGVRLLEHDFKQAVNRGAKLRILCGNYMNITQPQALYLLKGTLDDRVDLRFYNVPSKSFHPKAYIFEYDTDGDIFIGSSNISRSALTDGIEWNYRINCDSNPKDYNHFRQAFDDLFLNKSIIVDDNELQRYSKRWRRPKLFREMERLEDGTEKEHLNAALVPAEYAINKDEDKSCEIIPFPQPIGPQIEALYELNKTRLEGWDKGIVVAATGVGKTYLAAFDSKSFDSVLFVAHREEILFQAERTFKCVRPHASTGFFLGGQKEENCDILFASVQTLGKQEYLCDGYFKKDQFDYIVIDEFHHAAADTYRRVIDYFKPKFLLGLTATPERLDNQDVFALCDYNLVYEVRLKEAINKGWLVPFRYYGIYDETDYEKISVKNGKYDDKELEQALSINKRADLILQHYLKYNSKRALGFCSGRNHAVFMAEYFMHSGIKACAVISGSSIGNDSSVGEEMINEYSMDRKEAITKLKKGDMKVIFSVDMFNEGVDIPEVDMVMFLRPTESPTVFLQQLGRGLRKKNGKKYVNVLDFIGNYKKANLIPFLLCGDLKDKGKRNRDGYIPDEEYYPEDCIIDFDFRLINIFKKMAERQKNIFDRIKDEYYRIKEELGTRPLRLEMYTYMDEEIYSAVRTRKEFNIFKDYLGFLKSIDELTDDESRIINTTAHEFLKDMEKTSMTKTYKMPLLLAFYNHGDIKLSIGDNDIFESFKEFYSHNANAVDLLRDRSTQNYQNWGKEEYVGLARKNPMKFIMNSSPVFFYEEGERFCLTSELKKYICSSAFAEHFRDVIQYRTRKFYRERLEKRIYDTERSILYGNKDDID